MRSIAFALSLWLISSLIGTSAAQTGSGQLCLRSYEDRNSNGVYEQGGDVFITQDIASTLTDSQGIIVQTALLSDSQRNSEGVLCFQRLAAGQYSLNVVSAAYRPLTALPIVVSVVEGGVPPVLDYAAQIIAAAAPAPLANTPTNSQTIERILIAAGAALGVMCVWMFFGLILYLATIRPRVRRALSALGQQARLATAGYPPVPDTGRYAPVRPPTDIYAPVRPDTGSYPPAPTPSPDDSQRYRPN